MGIPTEVERMTEADIVPATDLDHGRVSPDHFRRVLGHFPTGVVVVTALDDHGDPIGMTIGSFTSVSLDPPLVAFLPTTRSRSFAALRAAGSVVINVLGASQEDVCRRFASPGADRFSGVGWHPASSGAPILDDVVAWIDAEFVEAYPAGDHVIALCAVRDLAIGSTDLPLLFFQGGYGRFTPSSLGVATAPDLVRLLRFVDVARPHMERLSAELELELTAQCFTADESVVMAGVGAPHAAVAPSRVGWRLPLVPPIGSVLMAWSTPSVVDAWLARLSPNSRVTEERVRASLAVIRARGYSVSGNFDEDLSAALDEWGESDVTTRRQMLGRFLDGMDGYDPPDLDSAGVHGLHHVAVPVMDDAGAPVMALNALHLRPGVGSAETDHVAAALTRTATAITADFSARRTGR